MSIVSNTYNNYYGVITFSGNLGKIIVGTTADTYPFVNLDNFDGQDTETIETNLTEISLPFGLTLLNSAFVYCTKLTNVLLPNSLQHIEDATFMFCPIEDIKLPKCLYSIGPGAFQGTLLKKVYIPYGVSVIDAGFAGCTTLQEVYIRRYIPATLSEDSFRMLADGFKLKVPACSLEKYKTADNWKDYADSIEEDSEGIYPPTNKVYYKTEDGSTIKKFADYYKFSNETLVSNTYTNGLGVLEFDRPITYFNLQAIDITSGKFLTELYLPTTIENFDLYGYIYLKLYLKTDNITEFSSDWSVATMIYDGLSLANIDFSKNSTLDIYSNFVYYKNILIAFTGEINSNNNILTVRKGTKIICGNVINPGCSDSIKSNFTIVIPNTVETVSCFPFFISGYNISYSIKDENTLKSCDCSIDTLHITENKADGVVYTNYSAIALKGTINNNSTITIKDGIKYIGSMALQTQSTVADISIILPNSIEKIYSAGLNVDLQNCTIPKFVYYLKSLDFNKKTILTFTGSVPPVIPMDYSYSEDLCPTFKVPSAYLENYQNAPGWNHLKNYIVAY